MAGTPPYRNVNCPQLTTDPSAEIVAATGRCFSCRGYLRVIILAVGIKAISTLDGGRVDSREPSQAESATRGVPVVNVHLAVPPHRPRRDGPLNRPHLSQELADPLIAIPPRQNSTRALIPRGRDCRDNCRFGSNGGAESSRPRGFFRARPHGITFLEPSPRRVNGSLGRCRVDPRPVIGFAQLVSLLSSLRNDSSGRHSCSFRVLSGY